MDGITLGENNKNYCFIDILSKLKESSLEAVESSKGMNDITRYMHVDRTVQREFEKLLLQYENSSNSKLILLCGSVGDGKSHLLSYYSEKYPDIMSKFQIHNDATASLFIDKPAIHTLKVVLNDFADENLNKNNKKLILAINLGTLNNFIESDDENRFTELKKFVEQEQILEDSLNKNSTRHINNNFDFINFTDYKLYSLTEKSPRSFYIENLLLKLIINTENNPFYKSYSNKCLNCESYKICPVRLNYELLFNKTYRDEIVALIIENIVKHKLIISSRALQNFIYEMIVDERFISLGSFEPRKVIEKLDKIQYCGALTPNILFSKENSSVIINNFRLIDPINIRSEKLDSFTVDFINSDDIFNIFKKHLPEFELVEEAFANIDYSHRDNNSLKKELLQLFIRLYRLYNKEDLFLVQDLIFKQFMEHLFNWNNGYNFKLKEIYSLVKKSVYKWNGWSEDNLMRLNTKSNQITYRLSQHIEIKECLDNIIPKNENEIEIFNDTLTLQFSNKNVVNISTIEIDFSLYNLLEKVSTGYVTDEHDKKTNIKFTTFVDEISNNGNKNEEIIITEVGAGAKSKLKLEYSEAFGYTIVGV